MLITPRLLLVFDSLNFFILFLWLALWRSKTFHQLLYVHLYGWTSRTDRPAHTILQCRGNGFDSWGILWAGGSISLNLTSRSHLNLFHRFFLLFLTTTPCSLNTTSRTHFSLGLLFFFFLLLSVIFIECLMLLFHMLCEP